jgi:hypothetical protein
LKTPTIAALCAEASYGLESITSIQMEQTIGVTIFEFYAFLAIAQRAAERMRTPIMAEDWR